MVFGGPLRAQEFDASLSEDEKRALTILADEEMLPSEKRKEIQGLLNANQNSADVWAAYGEALDQVGESDLALRAFIKATELNEDLWSPHFWIGILSKRGTPEPDLPRAEQAFRQALERGAPKARTLNELAVTLALQGMSKEAAALWEEAIAEDPEWGVLYANLMKAAAGIGDEALAAAYIDGAIAAERFDETAVMQYGEFLVRRDKADEAVRVYQKAIAAHPQNARLRFYLGLALSEMGEKEKALEELFAAKRLASSGSAPDVAQSAEWEIFKIEHPRDERHFQRAVELVFNPEPNTKKREKNLKEAVNILDAILGKHDHFWNGYFVRGVAHRRLDQREKAAADYARVMELHADEPNVTMEMALLKRDEHDFESAADLADRAIELAPRDPVFAVNGAFIMIEAGRCERAWELYRRALRMVGEENTQVLLDELEIRCRR